jgi:hypothetical protein
VVVVCTQHLMIPCSVVKVKGRCTILGLRQVRDMILWAQGMDHRTWEGAVDFLEAVVEGIWAAIRLEALEAATSYEKGRHLRLTEYVK